MGTEKLNETCWSELESLKGSISRAPILVSQDWKKMFRGHVDASKLEVGGTLTQLDENGNDRVI